MWPNFKLLNPESKSVRSDVTMALLWTSRKCAIYEIGSVRVMDIVGALEISRGDF